MFSTSYLFQKNYLKLANWNYLCTDLLFYKKSKRRLEILDEKLAKNREALPKTEKRITRGIFVAVFSACCKTNMFSKFVILKKKRVFYKTRCGEKCLLKSLFFENDTDIFLFIIWILILMKNWFWSFLI